MAKILPRSVWTNSAKGFTRYSARRFNKNAVTEMPLHYPADGNVTRGPNPSLEQTAALLRAYRNWHINGNGWADIGYNVGIDQAGRIIELAGLTHASAHCASTANPGANSRTIGVLLILGNNEKPTKAMNAAINALGAHLVKIFPNMRHDAIGHQQIRGASTSCPGIPVMSNIRAGVYKGFKNGSSAPKPAAPKPSAPSKPSSSKAWPNGPLPVGTKHTTASHNAWLTVLGGVGHTGTVAQRMQKHLRQKGYYKGSITGQSRVGPQTVTALQLFLRDRNFYKGRIDGSRGPQTIRAEFAFLNSQAKFFRK